MADVEIKDYGGEERRHETLQLGGLVESVKHLKDDLSDIKVDLNRIEEKIEDKYITKIEFAPVKNIVYGMIATSI